MAEFKFYCPQCGQQIQCDTGYTGAQINCPACKRPIVVPQMQGPGATAAHLPVPAQARTGRNILIIAAAVVVLAALAAAGWFGYKKYPRGHLQPALVALWSGDGNATDSISANNGTLVGDMSFAAGKVGQAFSFNGRNGYVSIPDSPSLHAFAGSITVMAWIRVNRTTTNPDWVWIVTKGNSSWELQCTVYAKTVTFNATGTSNTSLTGNRDVNDGQWHHVAGVYDGTRMFLYVDGTLDVSQPSTGWIAQNTYPVEFGQNAEAPRALFNGLIDEVSLYRRALTASEIRAIYKGHE